MHVSVYASKLLSAFISFTFVHIHSSVTGHLGCFHILTIIKNYSMGISVHICLFKIVIFFFRCISEVELLNFLFFFFFFFLAFERSSLLFSTVAAPIYIPLVYWYSLFSTCSPTFVICRHYYDNHFDIYEVISHCGFGLPFCDD